MPRPECTTSDEIAKNPQYGDFSLEQSQLGVEAFTIEWMT
jgi:hypothetical protein